MTIIKHFNRNKIKKGSYGTLQGAKVTKERVFSLLLVDYNLFLKSLIKEANREARNKKSKVTKQEHVSAVAKETVKTFRK